MLLEVTNLNIGEKIIIDTDDWDFEDVNLRPTQSDDYLIIYYNNWEYQVHADDFEAFVAEKLSLANVIEC